MVSNVSVVGSSEDSKYIAYGDDSGYNDALVFAFFIFKRTKLKSIVRDIDDIKRRFKFPLGVGIHCRELNSGQIRKKKGLDHLSEEDINSVLNNVITVVNRYQGLARFGYAFTDKSLGAFSSGELVMQSTIGEADIALPIAPNPKGILGFLAQMCFANGPQGGPNGPCAADCQIFISPDPTMTKFIGPRSTQAHYLTSGYIDDGRNIGKVDKVEPIIGGGKYPQLLDVADVLAYVCCHAIHKDPLQKKYNQLYDRLEWRVGSEFVLDPSP
ncbi:hypothetical protein [Pseudomonas sp. S09G 359]|jgi:hypothetical protein|uniref:hypothetical protein n=1 Tax=Pseudomonas sp. S09G 359 TaxID=2054919 RepID=UPI000C6D3F8A|nr:hypothetical protein [Pseudomonas sp. S09G 359]AUG08907.1 hypothetical protein CXQ82_20840 [Pseudomonas sp. S09G 359]